MSRKKTTTDEQADGQEEPDQTAGKRKVVSDVRHTDRASHEAHTAAPASASKYAVDSETTRTLRDLAPRFDNRLFLSATPHNGHSNSFSALLEILDPIRFTRGVPVSEPDALSPVMVRRLKSAWKIVSEVMLYHGGAMAYRRCALHRPSRRHSQ